MGILLALLVALAAPAVHAADSGGPGASTAAAQAPVILVFGDSLSAGYGIRVEQGWVSLLAQRIAREGYGFRVVNASVSGETTAGGLARLPARSMRCSTARSCCSSWAPTTACAACRSPARAPISIA